MASIKMNPFVLPLCLWLVYLLDSAAAEYCIDGSYCSTGCCSDSYGYYYCCYNVALTWWFWFMWGVILLIILTTCCAIIRRRQIRQRQVLVVRQQAYSGPVYGTLVNTEGPQQPYTQAGYNQYGGYPQPPPGPVPPYNQVPPGMQPPAQQVNPAMPVQQAGAVATKEAQYDPNDKPPPYNPGS
ncbi:WW domain binding protein 1-like isoform X2 [Patiria miniata]|uniref:Vesicular, overexpressed in cancer, prosurvival protein 1 n=1 Tax=Patiria miniata TaxID=46514 RepID=A0A914A9X3_PATMI|nr:WW domain binding protein 1-like isoform X2 [Patiria miniata]